MAVTGLRKWWGGALAMASIVQANAARAVCVTDAEAKSVALFVAPDMLRALATTCRPSLPGNAYLTRSSDALVARFRSASSGSWPAVQALLGRIPEVRLFRGLNEESARGMITAVIEDKGLGKVGPSDCSLADAMLAPLDPLPPENVASLIVALAKFGEMSSNERKAKAQKQSPKPSMFCPAVPR
jgi:hypothetical protein